MLQPMQTCCGCWLLRYSVDGIKMNMQLWFHLRFHVSVSMLKLLADVFPAMRASFLFFLFLGGANSIKTCIDNCKYHKTWWISRSISIIHEKKKPSPWAEK